MAASGGGSSAVEKRKDVRLERSLVTELHVDGAAYLGTIRNESRGGVFVQTVGPFSAGQDVTLTYTPPSGMDQKRTGKIVNLYPGGIGVKYNWPGYNR